MSVLVVGGGWCLLKDDGFGINEYFVSSWLYYAKDSRNEK